MPQHTILYMKLVVKIKLCFYTIAIRIANKLHVSNVQDKTKTESGPQVSLSLPP